MTAGKLLFCYLLLYWIPAAYDLVAGDTRGVAWSRGLLWSAVFAVLACWIWRGSRIPWVILLAVTVCGAVLLPMSVIWPWNSAVLWNLAASVGQIAILASPPVLRRIRPDSEATAD
jgi:hypothetical protein